MHNSQSASIREKGPSWSYGSWIYNYQYHQWLSPLTLWVLIQLRRGVLETTLCDKVCPWLSGGRWFSLGTLVSSTNKIDHHDITEMLLKVALNTITTNIYDWLYLRAKKVTFSVHEELICVLSLGWALYFISPAQPWNAPLVCPRMDIHVQYHE
jgi:hypothetical protein